MTKEISNDNNLLKIIPVLPSLNIERDVNWYGKMTGFKCHYSDKMYAIIYREDLCIHLQWHANTSDDPLLGGSVIRIFVKDIETLLAEFVQRGTVTNEKYIPETAWGTKEFGFHDLNKNAIFVVEDIAK